MAALGRLAKTILPAGLAGGAAYMLASTAVSNNAKAQAEQGKTITTQHYLCFSLKSWKSHFKKGFVQSWKVIDR